MPSAPTASSSPLARRTPVPERPETGGCGPAAQVLVDASKIAESVKVVWRTPPSPRSATSVVCASGYATGVIVHVSAAGSYTSAAVAVLDPIARTRPSGRTGSGEFPLDEPTEYHAVRVGAASLQ